MAIIPAPPLPPAPPETTDLVPAAVGVASPEPTAVPLSAETSPATNSETDAAPAPAAAIAPGIPAPVAPTFPSMFEALNKKQAAKRISKAVEDTTLLRKHLWPDVGEERLWLIGDKNKKGFSPIPRPLPILMSMIGDASKHVSTKSVPAGRSYLVLWCRVFGEALVKIENEMMAASEAGYSGERSVSTWREHMRVLKELGFIDTRPGGAGPMHYILLLNPYKVAMELRAKGWIQEVQFTALFHRAVEIGASPELNA